jgi:succinoglycan biosynthesis transport protein ExoP
MSALTSIDEVSSDVDVQYLAIQRQILLGRELISQTHLQMKQGGWDVPPVAEVGAMLRAEQVGGTNLVEMIAQGSDPEILPQLIDTWVDVYVDARAQDIATSVDATRQVITDELSELSTQRDLAREDLATFRKANNIVSSERVENEASARLNGMNASLNKARNAEVETLSALQAVREALARGETVGARSDQQTMRNMELELQKMKNQLLELDQRYTREYQALRPAMKVLPEQIADMGLEITERKRSFSLEAISAAKQAYAAAKKTLASLQLQYDDSKRSAETFAQTFLVQASLVGELESLEVMYGEMQSRLAQLKSSQVQKYPQVNVISSASEAVRVGPSYLILSLIALACAITAAMFAVWLISFLRDQKPDQDGITLPGIHIYPEEGKDAIAFEHRESAQRIGSHNPLALAEDAESAPGGKEVD